MPKRCTLSPEWLNQSITWLSVTVPRFCACSWYVTSFPMNASYRSSRLTMRTRVSLTACWMIA